MRSLGTSLIYNYTNIIYDVQKGVHVMSDILKHSELQAELLDNIRNVITKQLVASGYMDATHTQLSDFDDHIIEIVDINDNKVIKKPNTVLLIKRYYLNLLSLFLMKLYVVSSRTPVRSILLQLTQ